MWPGWAIFFTLGSFLKPVATINLPKFLTFLGNFCKGVKIYHFSGEILFGQLLKTFGDFFWSHWSYVSMKVIKVHFAELDGEKTFSRSKNALFPYFEAQPFSRWTSTKRGLHILAIITALLLKKDQKWWFRLRRPGINAAKLMTLIFFSSFQYTVDSKQMFNINK